MFTFLLLATTVIACFLAYLYLPHNNIKHPTKNTLILICWAMIFIAVMLMGNYLAVVGIPFSSQATSVDFFDCLSYDYIYNFIQMYIIYGIIGGICFILYKFRIKPYWIILFLGLFSIIIYYPGIPYNDTNDLYGYYLAHQYSDWQPALYSIWWNIFHFYGAAFLANNLSYYIGLTYISYYLSTQNKNWQNYLLVIFSITPIYFTQLNIVLKDTLFAGLLIDVIALYILSKRTSTPLLRILCYLVSILLLFLVVGTRYNGFTVVLPMLTLIIWSLINVYNWSKLRKIVVSIVGAIFITYIFVQANLFVVYKIFNASKNYTLTLVMQNDLANIECRTNHEFQMPAGLFVDQASINNLRQQMCTPLVLNEYNYDPLTSANWNNSGNPKVLFENGREEQFNMVKKIWFPTILRHPFIYSYYRLRFILNDLLAQYYRSTYVMTKINEWPEGLEKPDTYNPQILAVQKILAEFSLVQRMDMRYLLGIFIIIGTIATLFYLIMAKNYSIAFFIVLANIFALFGLYLALGSHAARFFLWNDIATLLAILLIE